MEFTPGYALRSDELPKQGSRTPWRRIRTTYDIRLIRRSKDVTTSSRFASGLAPWWGLAFL